MPWGISLMPPALTLAEAEPIEPPPPTARPGLAPAPESDPPELPVRAHEPSRDARAGERAMLPARIEREDKDPPKKKVGLVRVGRPVLSSPEPYDLGAQLASHLAWLDDDGRGDLERHLARGDHRKALAMIAKAKSSYPKNVSIGRCAQIVERAAIARLLLRVTPLEAIGRIEGHVEGKEARVVAGLFRGDATLDDALRGSPLPRLRTLELLEELLATGTLLLEALPTATPPVRPSHMRPRVEATLPEQDDGADIGARMTLPEPIDTAARAATLREDVAMARRSRAETPVPTGATALRAAKLLGDMPRVDASDPRVERSDDEDAPEPAEKTASKARTETPIATERVAAAIEAMQSAVLGGLDESHLPLQPHAGAGDATASPLPMAAKRVRPFRLPSPRADEEDGFHDKSRELGNAPTKRPPPPDPFELAEPPVFPKASRVPTDLGPVPSSVRSARTASVRPSDAPVGAPGPASVRGASVAAQAKAERSLALRVAVALGVVAVAASLVAVVVSLRARPAAEPTTTTTAAVTPIRAAAPTPAPTPPSSATPTVAASAKSATMPTIELFIDASPRFARVYVDDVLLTGRPIKEPFARDEREHEIRIEAIGYRPIKTRFTARGDTHLILSLEPIPTPVRVAPTPSSGTEGVYP